MVCGRAVALRASALFRGHPAAAGARPLPARRLRPRPAPRAASPPVRGSGYIGPSGRLRRCPCGRLVALRPVGRSAGSRPPSAPCSRAPAAARLPPGLFGRGSSGPGGRSARGGRWPGLRPAGAPWSASPRAPGARPVVVVSLPAFCRRVGPGAWLPWSPCGHTATVAQGNRSDPVTGPSGPQQATKCRVGGSILQKSGPLRPRSARSWPPGCK